MNVETKTCTKCKGEKILERFSKDKQRPDGFSVYCKDCRADYYLQNHSQIIIKNQEYREKNRSRVREWNQRYNIKRFFFTCSRRLRIQEKGETASHKELASLWKIQRGCCALTGRRLNRENVHLDHIIPLVRGGSSTIENLRWLHRDVNFAKRDLFDAEFIALCQEVTLANLMLTKKSTGG